MKTQIRFLLVLIILSISGPSNLLMAQWTESLNTDEIIHYDDAIQINEQYIFCCTYDNIYRSADEGATWQLSLDTKSEEHTYNHVRNMYVKGDQIWAVGDWELGEYFIQYSDNSGTSWRSLTTNGYPKSCIINHRDVLFMGCQYYTPGNMGTMFRSFDNGTTWEQLINKGLPEKTGEITQLIEFEGRLFAYQRAPSGVYTTNDLGETWTLCNNTPTIENARFEWFGITPLGLLLSYSGQNNDNTILYKEHFLTKDGKTWTKLDAETTPNTDVMAKNDKFWFRNDASNQTQISANKGANWYNWDEIVHWNANVKTMKGTKYFALKNTVFALFGNDLYRRPLTEFVVPPIPAPSELESTGIPALDELLEKFGASSLDELPLTVLESFMDNFEDNGLWDEPFSGGQPGSCSGMGMPLWSVDAVSAQLHIQDRIFESKSNGPDVKMDIYFARNVEKKISTLGAYWSFGYDAEVQITNEAVSLVSLPNGKKTFPLDAPINASTVLTDKMNPGNTLKFDGTDWVYTSLRERLTYRYKYYSNTIYLLSQITDNENNSLTINRNPDGKITQITDAVGRVITFQYTNNACTGFTLPDGRSCTFSYNANNLLAETSDLADLSTLYTYTADSDISTMTIEGKLIEFDYEKIQGFNRVIQVVDANLDSIHFHFEYIDENETVFKIRSGGVEKQYYSSNGTTKSVRNSQGITASRLFDAEQKLLGIRNSDGTEESLTYNAAGDILEVVSNEETIFTYTWDNKHNITSKTNALGNTWLYSYDTNNRLIEVTSPENRKTEIDYYANGKLKSVKTGTITETYTYDNFGNLATISNAKGGVTSFTYDTFGYKLISQTSPLGHTTSYNYDNNQRLVSIEYPDGNTTEYTYDCCAQTEKTDENNHTTQIGRNSKNMITSITNVEGDSRNWIFNEKGRPVEYTNTLGYTRTYSYNASNLMSESIDEKGNSTRYFYDLNNQLILIQDAKKHQTKYMRSSSGELMGIVYSTGDSILYQRDAIHQITKVRNARKQEITMNYDKDGNAIQRITPEETQTFTWNSQQGLLMGYSNSEEATSYQRDAVGIIKTINYPKNLSVEIQHDADGNVTQYNYPGGFSIANEFDSRGRLKTISWDDKSIELQYDNAGNLLKEIRSGNNQTTYTYSSTNLVTGIDHSLKQISEVDYQITRDKAGKIISTDSKPAIAPKKGLISLFDYTYEGSNQLSWNRKADMGTETYFQYDGDGNCTNIIGQLNLKASYSSLNQLTGLKVDNDSIELTYDAMGNVVSLKKNDEIKLFFYDHKNRLLFETDKQGTPVRYYVYKGKRLMAFIENGVSYFMQYDYNGNTILVSDDAGKVYNRYCYSAFGEVLAKEETINNLHTFTGAFGVFDLANGYYLMRARLYHATNARFLQRDPLNYQGDVNAYRYASNNPISGMDPLGLDDGNQTVNAAGFDGSNDYDTGIAGGTADAFNPKLKHSANSGTDPVEILSSLYNGITDSPLGDFIPGNLGNIVGAQKAAKKAQDGKGFFEIAWQFVPFNNTMQFVYDEKKKDLEKRAHDYYYLPDGREKLVDKPFSSCSLW